MAREKEPKLSPEAKTFADAILSTDGAVTNRRQQHGVKRLQKKLEEACHTTDSDPHAAKTYIERQRNARNKGGGGIGGVP